MDTTTLLIIVLVILLLGGGGWYGPGPLVLSNEPPLQSRGCFLFVRYGPSSPPCWAVFLRPAGRRNFG